MFCTKTKLNSTNIKNKIHAVVLQSFRSLTLSCSVCQFHHDFFDNQASFIMIWTRRGWARGQGFVSVRARLHIKYLTKLPLFYSTAGCKQVCCWTEQFDRTAYRKQMLLRMSRTRVGDWDACLFSRYQQMWIVLILVPTAPSRLLAGGA